MSKYRGYLKPHEARIRRLAREGKSPGEIGRILYADGVRSTNNGGNIDHAASFAGLIYNMLGLRPNNRKEKLKRRIARAKKELAALERGL
jgi:hypothetical protein